MNINGKKIEVKYRRDGKTDIGVKRKKQNFDSLYNVLLEPSTLMPTEIYSIAEKKVKFEPTKNGKFRMKYGKNATLIFKSK